MNLIKQMKKFVDKKRGLKSNLNELLDLIEENRKALHLDPTFDVFAWMKRLYVET